MHSPFSVFHIDATTQTLTDRTNACAGRNAPRFNGSEIRVQPDKVRTHHRSRSIVTMLVAVKDPDPGSSDSDRSFVFLHSDTVGVRPRWNGNGKYSRMIPGTNREPGHDHETFRLRVSGGALLSVKARRADMKEKSRSGVLPAREKRRIFLLLFPAPLLQNQLFPVR